MTTNSSPSGGTRGRVLESACRLFAAKGYRDATVQEICDEAGANVAAVNYYYGSKMALAREVFKRRMEPLNAERIRLLDESEDAADGTAPLEDVLRAFIAPTIQFGREQPDCFRLFQRFHTEPPEFREQVLSPEMLAEVITRFRAAFVRALPDAPVARIWWGVHFVLGAMIHVASGREDIERVSGGEATDPGDREMVEWLVEFGAAGMRGIGRRS